ncbi:hypothetical protein HMPREF1545_01613 [Oscillibacter sp. KLE 1728]|nr:hypothetical protein HMPREF1545_01613 [Oscillibacter sp. KLE 1728]
MPMAHSAFSDRVTNAAVSAPSSELPTAYGSSSSSASQNPVLHASTTWRDGGLRLCAWPWTIFATTKVTGFLLRNRMMAKAEK